jgi:tetratricopeptide (TPR) repeat protein
VPRIFISYRRDDAAGDAGRLADHLQRHFGRDQVFLDIDTIDPGRDFVQVLHASLQETAAVLVVIGPRWTTASDAAGARRLDNTKDFVRLEVEAALGRTIPVVPVLVQGAAMPRAEELPAALASLATRQAVVLDHAEFHDDTERLCDRLEQMIAGGKSPWQAARKWWPAAAVAAVVAIGAGYVALRPTGENPEATTTGSVTLKTNAAVTASTAGSEGVKESGQSRRVDELLAAAEAQRGRNQFAEAMATLAGARELAPASAAVRRAQEDVAMEWIRNARVVGGKGSFRDAIGPALAVVDTSLPSATGARRADLLAHTGWATFLLWRDGDRHLNPADAYREALSIDPANPYANAMLAHWILFQDREDVPGAVKLFDTAAKAGRALGDVRTLQWAAFGNASSDEANPERVRLADAMRRGGEKLNGSQAQALFSLYVRSTPVSREKDRQALLDALTPDDHISTLGWAFDEYASRDEFRRRTIRYYVALLHEKAARVEQAVGDLRTLDKELAETRGSDSLHDAVRAALKRLKR